MADTLHNLYIGFSVALAPQVLLYAFVGCVVGTLVGVLPGIGPLAGISLLLPLPSDLMQPPPSCFWPAFTVLLKFF